MRADWKPALPRAVTLRHDGVRDTDLLLMPERVVRLTGPAGAILRLCDGTRTADDIVMTLAARYPDAPIATEVPVFLQQIKEEGWLI